MSVRSTIGIFGLTRRWDTRAIRRWEYEDLVKHIINTPLTGNNFTSDNFKLCQLLVLGDTSVSHANLYKSTQDGCKAWLSLEETCAGEDSRQARIRDAHQ